MTGKQIEHLKSALANSKLADNSSKLDELILKSAHDSAQQTKANTKSNFRSINLLGLLPMSFLRSATLAVILTLGVFLAMGQVLNVDEATIGKSKRLVNNAETVIDNVVSQETLNEPRQSTITKPEHLVLEPAPSGLSRDQILMSFELSDTEELLAESTFEFTQNSAFTQNKVVLAIADINSLIQVGELDNARQRYSELITECNGCGLPKTLEALVLAAQEFASKTNASKTG